MGGRRHPSSRPPSSRRSCSEPVRTATWWRARSTWPSSTGWRGSSSPARPGAELRAATPSSDRQPCGGSGGDESVIRTEGLVKRYGRLTAVDHVDLDVRDGDLFGFLGPNGSGKTTTIRMLLGLVHASAAAIELLGHPVPAGSGRPCHGSGRWWRDPASTPTSPAGGTWRSSTRPVLGVPYASSSSRRRRIGAALERVGLADVGPAPGAGLFARDAPAAGSGGRTPAAPSAAGAGRAHQRPRPPGHPRDPQPLPRAGRARARPCSCPATSWPRSSFSAPGPP